MDAENKDKWDDAQQVRGLGFQASPPTPHPCLGPLYPLCLQVSPGSVHLLRVVEDFIHLVGDALKAFQSSLIVTDNLGTRGQAREVGAGCGGTRAAVGEGWFLRVPPISLALWALCFPRLTPSLYLSPCLFPSSTPVWFPCVRVSHVFVYQPGCLCPGVCLSRTGFFPRHSPLCLCPSVLGMGHSDQHSAGASLRRVQ